jgi:hypothetical protein
MGRPTDKDVEGDQQQPREPAGRVEHDSRGKAVWRWACDVLESTSVLLKRLENRDLALEPTQKVPIVRGARGKTPQGKGSRDEVAREHESAARHPAAVRSKRRDTGGGFDPYNSR